MNKNSKIKKVLLTGGHAGSTAYAVVEEIKKKGLNWKIYFIGSKTAVEGKNVMTYEQRVLPKLGVIYVPLNAGRFQRKFTVWTIPSLLKIPFGFAWAIYLLIKINPDVVLSFGGFVALPVVFAAWLLGKKIMIHEQTAAVGLANKYSSFFATKIAISRPNSLKYFPAEKTILTGNPVSSEVLSIKRDKNRIKPYTIFVTGGSRGSVVLNEAIGLLLPKLLAEYKIIHQTGEVNFHDFEIIKASLSPQMQKGYEVYGLMEPAEWKKALTQADLVLTRAGANIVSELMVLKIPAIFVPIPFSYLDEQTKNANYAKKFNDSVVIKQADLTPETLYTQIKSILSKKNEVDKDAISPDSEASRLLVAELEGLGR